MTTTPSLSAIQAGEQIRRENISWSILGTAAEVSYGFRVKAAPEDYGNKERASFSRANDAEKAVVAALHDLAPGSYHYSTVLHEIGHAIGLAPRVQIQSLVMIRTMCFAATRVTTPSTGEAGTTRRSITEL